MLDFVTGLLIGLGVGHVVGLAWGWFAFRNQSNYAPSAAPIEPPMSPAMKAFKESKKEW